MKSGLFAGSFDPPTLGHEDVIKRAAHLCDRLYVGLAENTVKTNSLFSLADRRKMLESIARDIPQVKVVVVSGLVVDFVREHRVEVLIRSLRGLGDLEQEFAMGYSNREMCGVDTVFLMADPRYAAISSTVVREIARMGGPIDSFVPREVAQMITKPNGGVEKL